MALPPTPAGPSTSSQVDVLCVGHASYDLVFTVPHHPGADEKIFASQLISCGGGPAANASIAVSRLGGNAVFCGFLGDDLYGEAHLRELVEEGIDTRWVCRGPHPTPLSAVLVKPDGSRALVNHKGSTPALQPDQNDVSPGIAKVLLLDGHEPLISPRLAEQARRSDIPVVLDAGSLHHGTAALLDHVDVLACSEKFADQYLGEKHVPRALEALAERSPAVIITLGERGLAWRRGTEAGTLPAFPVDAVDTTGAGDTFHGALALAIAHRQPWQEALRFASAAGALCCTHLGARTGIPSRSDVDTLLAMGEVS